LKITGLRQSADAGKKTVAATVTWENAQRPPMEVFFRVSEEQGDALSLNPEAFMTVGAVSALLRGEQRIAVEGAVDPQLLHGLNVVMRTLKKWQPRLCPYALPRIEAEHAESVRPGLQARAGMFFSGGLDSLATLRANRLAFAPGHPQYFATGVFVSGLQTEVDANSDEVARSLAAIGADAGLEVLPVETNARLVEADWALWTTATEASVFASVAHALSGGLGRLTLAPSEDIGYLHPGGTHPVLDPWYSSESMRILHDDVTLTRLDKVRLIADWPAALDNLRVCNLPPMGQLNCGACDKCVRTMLELLAAGVLDRSNSFPSRSLTAAMVLGSGPLYDDDQYFPELMAPIEALGRSDLKSAMQTRMRKFYWKQLLQRCDSRYFGGSVAKIRQLLRARESKRSREERANAPDAGQPRIA
jgi:hypothetical protein